MIRAPYYTLVFWNDTSLTLNCHSGIINKINQYNIELYTDLKDLSLERKLEEALDEASIFYNKSETWIESESLYEVLYTFEMEGENNAKEQSEV